MRFTDREINAAVRRLCAIGYQRITPREQRIVDALCAIC